MLGLKVVVFTLLFSIACGNTCVSVEVFGVQNVDIPSCYTNGTCRVEYTGSDVITGYYYNSTNLAFLTIRYTSGCTASCLLDYCSAIYSVIFKFDPYLGTLHYYSQTNHVYSCPIYGFTGGIFSFLCDDRISVSTNLNAVCPN